MQKLEFYFLTVGHAFILTASYSSVTVLRIASCSLLNLYCILSCCKIKSFDINVKHIRTCFDKFRHVSNWIKLDQISEFWLFRIWDLTKKYLFSDIISLLFVVGTDFWVIFKWFFLAHYVMQSLNFQYFLCQ